MKMAGTLAVGLALVGTVVVFTPQERLAEPLRAEPAAVWSLKNDGIDTSEKLSGVSAPDESTVWATGTGGIYRSVDGGDSYTKVLVHTDQDEILAVDPNTAWGMANFSIRKTTDGGSSWTVQPVFSWPDKNGICAFDANTLYTVAWEGAIGRTTDGGVTWGQVRGPTYSEQFFGDCQAPTPSVAYVVGFKGAYNTSSPAPVVYKTTDGGASWSEVFSGDGILGVFHDTAMTDANTLWAVGGARRSPGTDGPLVAHTTDGGATWTTQVLELSEQPMILNDIARSTTGLLLAVGSRGIILASTDNGATWQPEESGTTADLYKVAVVGEKAWAVGREGTILKRQEVQDSDNDGVADDDDNCPTVYNPDQTDTDGDGIGDACEPRLCPPWDRDCDGYYNYIEMMRGSNPDDPTSTPEHIAILATCQDGLDNDKDGLIDTADPGCPLPDADGDGVPDKHDNCRFVPNPGQEDLDGDGQGDACDWDDDGDGYTDFWERLLGSDPRNAGSTPEHRLIRSTCTDRGDNDKDGLTDGADPGCAG